MTYQLVPPALAAKDTQGRPCKQRFGGGGFRVLAHLKVLSGTVLDPFCRTEERCMERALPAEYRTHIERALTHLACGDIRALADALMASEVAGQIRGYGHVKLRSVERARSAWKALARSQEAC